MMKDYWTIVEAKPLWPVNETFYSIPTYGANCCYLDHLNSWASTAQCEPVKRRTSGGVPTASPMIKSANDGGEKVEISHNWN